MRAPNLNRQILAIKQIYTDSFKDMNMHKTEGNWKIVKKYTKQEWTK